MPTLVAYVRVSTDAQVERGHSLADQEAAISRWAKGAGHRVVAVCRDEGMSGSNGLDTRLGLYEALDMVATRRAAGLVLVNLDRLARKLTVQEAVLAKVWDGGGRVFTVEDGGEVLEDDPDDPVRTAMRQMRGVFAQLERGMITKRLRDGRRAKADRGGFAYGSPPYGYRAVEGQLIPDATEQAALNLMRRLHQEGQSTRQIAAALSEAGHTTKRGKAWVSASVARTLQR